MQGMKPATTRGPSQTTVTTITEEKSERVPLPEFWGYIEGLKPEDWSNHICYIYRMDPRQQMDYGSGSGSTALEKVVGTFEIRPGVSIPFNDREEIELAIREKYGGKTFRLFLKRGHERICETRITNEYPPKYPATGALAGTPQTGPGPVVLPATDASNTADVARTAISTLAGQDARMTDVAVRALTGAAEVVTRMAATERAASPMDQAFQTIMV